MICLIAGTYRHAERWANAQGLRVEEWFWPATVFDIYGKRNFHTITVPDGIDHLSNDQLNRLLQAAWTSGRQK